MYRYCDVSEVSFPAPYVSTYPEVTFRGVQDLACNPQRRIFGMGIASDTLGIVGYE